MAWWILCVALSLAALAGIPAAGYRRDKREKQKRTLFRYYCVAGVYLSALFLVIPIQAQALKGTEAYAFRVFFSSATYTLQMFTINTDYNGLMSCAYPAGWIGAVHSAVLSAEFVAAPLLTLTVVLSFFRNVSAWYRFLRKYNQDAYVFSELNERSLVLAESIGKRDPKACLVFAGVTAEKEEEMPGDWTGKAREIGAVCYPKDILSIRLDKWNPARTMSLYLIGTDETENIVQGMDLMNRYGDRSRWKLYVFTSRDECEYLLNRKKGEAKDNGTIKARRINAVSSLITRTLFRDGCRLLYGTAPGETPQKISAVLMGLGQHGMEMLKALTWYGRMYGYELEIHAFDKDPDAKERIAAACPELFWPEGESGETPCRIHVYPGTQTESPAFAETLKKAGNPAYALVALGGDEANIRTAVRMRTLFEQNGCRPVIQAIVYNSQEKVLLEGISNFKGQLYGIEFIGDTDSAYTESVLINSDLEQAALQIHMDYPGSDPDSFYGYEYNYRSSCAAAIHMRAAALQLSRLRHIDTGLLKEAEAGLRSAYKMSGQKDAKQKAVREIAGKLAATEGFSFAAWDGRKLIEPELLAEAEDAGMPEETAYHYLLAVKLMALEHERWCAYMRTEGYRYAEKRNDLGKMHNDLLPYSRLQEKEKGKDLHISLLIGEMNRQKAP